MSEGEGRETEQIQDLSVDSVCWRADAHKPMKTDGRTDRNKNRQNILSHLPPERGREGERKRERENRDVAIVGSSCGSCLCAPPHPTHLHPLHAELCHADSHVAEPCAIQTVFINMRFPSSPPLLLSSLSHASPSLSSSHPLSSLPLFPYSPLHPSHVALLCSHT